MNKYKEIEYIVFLNSTVGSFCGYVKVPKTHPYYKFRNTKSKVFSRTINTAYDKIDIDCHGGLTFSEVIKEKNNYPQGFSEGFWIGWDYSHYGDFMAFAPNLGGTTYQYEEVENECKNVIRQLLKIK